ncbi:ATP-binding cassette domain-containing protein [bacterium]|nr:ATP-binding cassette domain-containing protein [bacterium]
MTHDAAFIHAEQTGLSFDGRSLSLREVSFSMCRGEFVSIVGPSGCGKSTLLRLIAGLRSPSQGTLTVDGHVPGGAQTRTAFVFQEPNLLPWRTVRGNVGLPLELDRRTANAAAETDAKITQAIRLVGLNADDDGKRPRQLSGGMRMRVSLARALVIEPEIMLLDEPFAALDDILRQQLNEELQRIWWQRRWTGLFVTHNVAEAVFLSQRVLIMSRSPGTLIGDVSVPFAFPREPALRASSEFAKLTGEVSALLRRAAEDAA